MFYGNMIAKVTKINQLFKNIPLIFINDPFNVYYSYTNDMIAFIIGCIISIMRSKKIHGLI